MLDKPIIKLQEEFVGGINDIASRILLLEDNGSALKSILTLSNYTVCRLKVSDDLFEIARNFAPDLILSSYEQVETNDIVERMRDDQYLSHVPIIVIANRFNIKKAIKNLNGNVDDYIVKPFQPEELTARLGRIISRHEKLVNSNPLTKLPGNISIKKEIEKRLYKEEEFCLCYADLDNFKAFNDYYGYEKGDGAIRLTGRVIQETCKRLENDEKTTFLGHIGGDDFIFITSKEKVRRICEDIINGFDQKILSLYNEKDLSNGWIVSVDRSGKRRIFPIMSISISVVINSHGQKRHQAEFSQIGTELKKYIKSFPGSNYIIDRRDAEALSEQKTFDKQKTVLSQRKTRSEHFDKRF